MTQFHDLHVISLCRVFNPLVTVFFHQQCTSITVCRDTCGVWGGEHSALVVVVCVKQLNARTT